MRIVAKRAIPFSRSAVFRVPPINYRTDKNIPHSRNRANKQEKQKKKPCRVALSDRKNGKRKSADASFSNTTGCSLRFRDGVGCSALRRPSTDRCTPYGSYETCETRQKRKVIVSLVEEKERRGNWTKQTSLFQDREMENITR